MKIPTNPREILEVDSIVRRENDQDTIVIRFRWKFPFEMVKSLTDKKPEGILGFSNKNLSKRNDPRP